MNQQEDYTEPNQNNKGFETEAESALGDLMSEYEEVPTMAFTMELSSLSHAGATDIGHRRRHNEDYYGIQYRLLKQETPQGSQSTARGLYIVCDGMGGHSAGEVASAMAVEVLQQYFESHWQNELPNEETIREGILLANEKIHAINKEKSRAGAGRMGTTLVMALVQDTEVAIAHVGDSRVYQVNQYGDILQLTVDHEVGQREIAKGVSPEEAYQMQNAYQLTQALGPRKNDLVNPDIQYLEIQEDTLLVLCSDGLSDGALLEDYGETYLTPLLQSKADLEKGVLDLIELANQQHGHDNITAVVVQMKLRPSS
ncbi:serine/threonine phosphatase [Euhalothece natronophila Z-M001]|uniref:Serine/threonine phosphatase n=1 Tax=Euhalothece natronophila Z-M001 TaxID=522448 RepID=A0A5B8NQL3_9CHRO|nr:serine/threonine phosphatase [Euhalothece natronophila]QDZ40485.1 serine/threonine phosphatase [Euhalothece natronophila Z-M001]